jgi:hypothetical protein
MAPVPGWARVLAALLAVATAPFLAASVLLGTLSFAATGADLHRVSSYTMGAAPHVRVDAGFGGLVVVGDRAGSVVVDERRGATSVTRAAAAAAIGRTPVTVTQQGDLIEVRQPGQLFQGAINRSAELTVRVPPDVDLDVEGVGDVEVTGLAGTLHVTGSVGVTRLRHVTLRGQSTIEDTFGDLRLEDVTVSGTTRITKRLGALTFDGSLTPGGTVLDVVGGNGDVSLTLPYPTDARASIATQVGSLSADHVWGFVSGQPVAPRRWVADLGPSPSGRINVVTDLGDIEVRAR